ncbi:hypothetical protein AVEN_77390-1 [Araneus ventricosus]|uniref:Uncharacterized protein n=1 Tax=Araneus ventricosus TaxID=182803 RepID=A0A4Y2C8C1_ARAVE|nr:hypothetical protein AVEN_77390-1 [Araneus ventricosus]
MYYLYKKHETAESIENKRGRDRKPKKSTREDSMNVRFAQKKTDISSREIASLRERDLKLNLSALFRILLPYFTCCSVNVLSCPSAYLVWRLH